MAAPGGVGEFEGFLEQRPECSSSCFMFVRLKPLVMRVRVISVL